MEESKKIKYAFALIMEPGKPDRFGLVKIKVPKVSPPKQ